MVNIKDVRISNAAFRTSRNPVVAVFVGATSGIGLATLKELAASTEAAIYMLGRSKVAATRVLDELADKNPKTTIHFIETEISLIKNVDKVCGEIASKEKKIDLLFMSPGGVSFGGKEETSEGLDIGLALRYFNRLRFVQNLLPLLEASDAPRVIAILAGGKEKEIELTNIDMRTNFSSIKAAGLGSTLTTLAFEELAKTHPKITFIHKYPGFVNTGGANKILDSVPGLLAIPARFFKWFLLPILNLIAIPPAVVGERCLFIATSSRYPPSKPVAPGVVLPEGVQVAESNIVVDGIGNGVYSLDENDEPAPATAAIQGYRTNESGKIVWQETLTVWERALARSA